MRILLFLIAFLAVVSAAQAQTIAVGLDSATFLWTWTPTPGSANPDEFRLYCGGPPVAVPPTERSFPVASVVKAPGTYTCHITAANQFGESAPSNSVTFTTGNPPAGDLTLDLGLKGAKVAP